MRLVSTSALLVLALLLAAAGAGGGPAAPSSSAVVASITDGDTLRLTSGDRVRLLQIDTPELGSSECYSRAARTALLQRVPVGSGVELEIDPRLDRVDRYGRLLRYVHRGTTNVNVALVRAGAAAPYFYAGDLGRYATRLLADARAARAARRGLWGACPSTALDPYRQVDTGPSGGRTRGFVGGGCDPNYAGGCVPPYPPDLDCADLRARGIPTPVKVVGADPHHLDGDGDGLGCEPPRYERGRRAASVREEWHRNSGVAADEHRSRDRFRAVAVAHLVECGVECDRAPVLAQAQLHAIGVLEVREGDADERDPPPRDQRSCVCEEALGGGEDRR